MAVAKLKAVAAVVLAFSLVAGGVGVAVQRGLGPQAGPAVVEAPVEAPVVAAATPPPPAAELPPPPPPPESKPAEEKAPETRENERARNGRPDAIGLLERLERDDTVLLVRRLEDGDPPQRTFALSRDVQIVIDDHRPGRLADLTPGLRVNLFLTPDRTAVSRLVAEGPRQRRQVREVDVRERCLVVAGEGARNSRLPVAADATVTINGRRAQLADVVPGPVEIKLSVDLKTVLAIMVGTDRERDEGARREK
jgi:hypothetical protein